jgi:hypothetical protein
VNAPEGTAWQWRDSNGGSGTLQRVVVTAEGRYQAAYRDYMAHLPCTRCDAHDGNCGPGETLRKATQAARGSVGG